MNGLRRGPVGLLVVLALVIAACGSSGETIATVLFSTGESTTVDSDQLADMIEVIENDDIFYSVIYPNDPSPADLERSVLSRLIRQEATLLALEKFEVELPDLQREAFEQRILNQLEQVLVSYDSLDPAADALATVDRVRAWIDMTVVGGAGEVVLSEEGIIYDALIGLATVEIDERYGVWDDELMRVVPGG